MASFVPEARIKTYASGYCNGSYFAKKRMFIHTKEQHSNNIMF